MAGALEAVDGDGVDPHPFGGQGVADAGALMDDDDAMGLEVVDMLLGLVAGGLDDLHAALDDGLAVLGVGRRVDGRQDGQVHAEGLVGQLAAALDLGPQGVRRRLGQGGDEAQTAGVGHRGDQLGPADPLHAALHDGVLHTDKLGETRLDRHDVLPLAFGPSPLGRTLKRRTQGQASGNWATSGRSARWRRSARTSASEASPRSCPPGSQVPSPGRRPRSGGRRRDRHGRRRAARG